MQIRYEEALYYGQVKVNKAGESIRHGLGGLYYNSGRYYEGEWENGLRHGKGFLNNQPNDPSQATTTVISQPFELFENGNSYQGGYYQGRAHGEGTYKWANGEIYTGQWKDGFRHGKGKWVGIHGDSYEGDWYQGKAHGYGVYIAKSTNPSQNGKNFML